MLRILSCLEKWKVLEMSTEMFHLLKKQIKHFVQQMRQI